MNYVWAYEYVQNTRLGADGEEEPLSGELLNPEDVPEDDPTVYSKAVSYTHLDVYKRQDQIWAGRQDH